MLPEAKARTWGWELSAPRLQTRSPSCVLHLSLPSVSWHCSPAQQHTGPFPHMKPTPPPAQGELPIHKIVCSGSSSKTHLDASAQEECLARNPTLPEGSSLVLY